MLVFGGVYLPVNSVGDSKIFLDPAPTFDPGGAASWVISPQQVQLSSEPAPSSASVTGLPSFGWRVGKRQFFWGWKSPKDWGLESPSQNEDGWVRLTVPNWKRRVRTWKAVSFLGEPAVCFGGVKCIGDRILMGLRLHLKLTPLISLVK